MEVTTEKGKLVLDLEGAEFDFTNAPGFTHNDIFQPDLHIRNGIFTNSYIVNTAPRGHKLTKALKGLFGARAGGAKLKKR